VDSVPWGTHPNISYRSKHAYREGTQYSWHFLYKYNNRCPVHPIVLSPWLVSVHYDRVEWLSVDETEGLWRGKYFDPDIVLTNLKSV
jgi:hypothetical protein